MSILIGAAVFAEAIKMLGGITVISNTLAAVKSAPTITMILMSIIAFSAGMLLGSGSVSWYAFGPLVPDVTAQIGVFTAIITLPVQLSSGIGRYMSPIVGIVITISGMVELDIMDIVRRCSIPVIVMYVYNLVVSYPVV